MLHGAWIQKPRNLMKALPTPSLSFSGDVGSISVPHELILDASLAPFIRFPFVSAGSQFDQHIRQRSVVKTGVYCPAYLHIVTVMSPGGQNFRTEHPYSKVILGPVTFLPLDPPLC